MHREVKRVPLDFDWPLHEEWAGYRNPYDEEESCPECGGTGYSPQARRLRQQWEGTAPFKPSETGSTPILPTDRGVMKAAIVSAHIRRNIGGDVESEVRALCTEWNRRWAYHLSQADVDALWADGWLREHAPGDWRRSGAPPAALVNEWTIGYHPYEWIDGDHVIRNACQRYGWPMDCECCKGRGRAWPSNAAKALYESWQPVEPPVGEGYQVWAVLEESDNGFPLSAVFETAEQAQNWMDAAP